MATVLRQQRIQILSSNNAKGAAARIVMSREQVTSLRLTGFRSHVSLLQTLSKQDEDNSQQKEDMRTRHGLGR